jgi:hypothetical protein
MKVEHFINEISSLSFDNVFNPYSERCEIYDFLDAPQRRRELLSKILSVACKTEVDSIWIGRDLGYRGGRRTGLAFTDDVHFSHHLNRWGIKVNRPTKGHIVIERTASVIWSVLSQISSPVFLWNVFPLHPFEAGEPFTNRAHNAKERIAGEEILAILIEFLKPNRIIAIGNDAEKSANKIAGGIEVIKVRHPSYGGQSDFLAKIHEIYSIRISKQLQLI